MDERSYKQRLVTRCDEIIGGGGRRLGENSVAPPIPLVGARARVSARQERLWCPRLAPTLSRAAPSNDGKQLRYRGQPVFVATPSHAAAAVAPAVEQDCARSRTRGGR